MQKRKEIKSEDRWLALPRESNPCLSLERVKSIRLMIIVKNVRMETSGCLPAIYTSRRYGQFRTETSKPSPTNAIELKQKDSKSNEVDQHSAAHNGLRPAARRSRSRTFTWPAKGV